MFFRIYYSWLLVISFLFQINDLKLESSTKYWDLLTDEVSVTHDKQKSRLLKPIFEGQGTLTASLNYYSENKERLEVILSFLAFPFFFYYLLYLICDNI